MKVIVGLGNPGTKYENTRHNVGFMAVDSMWERISSEKFKEKFESEYGEIFVGSEKYLFIKPLTFMNNSGLSLKKWQDFYRFEAEDVYIIHDELDLPVGTLRLKTGGSAGGHNGLKSIIAHLGTEEFNRLRIGIDRDAGSIVQYVLGNFSKNDQVILTKEIFPKLDVFLDRIERESFGQLMNDFNRKNKE